MAEERKDNLEGRCRYEYGADYDAHALDQYKLYVEMADRISQRRQTANTFFLTVNTALVAFLGVSFPDEADWFGLGWYSVVGIAGVLLAMMWYRLIRSYRDLNSAKFQIIHKMEDRLPLKPYKAEWQAVGCGEQSRLYVPFTHIETRIPWAFMFLYVALIVAVLVNKL